MTARRRRLTPCHFSSATIISMRRVSEARDWWAGNGRILSDGSARRRSWLGPGVHDRPGTGQTIVRDAADVLFTWPRPPFRRSNVPGPRLGDRHLSRLGGHAPARGRRIKKDVVPP